MKLLAIGRPRAGAGGREIGRYAGREVAALWHMYRDGVVREMYSPGRPELHPFSAFEVLFGDRVRP
jgi:hypothetical protein